MTLKKRGEATAEEMASALDITVSGVRQHIAVLRAAGFVEHAAAKGRPGRPRHLHRLTPQAEAFFPKTYGDLTNELLAYLSEDDPAALERVFERRRGRRVHDATSRLAGKPFEERVAELATILGVDGDRGVARPRCARGGRAPQRLARATSVTPVDARAAPGRRPPRGSTGVTLVARANR